MSEDEETPLPRVLPEARRAPARTRVLDLQPGDLVTLGGAALDGQSATFIASGPHPLYLQLRLVIWRLEDGTWSLDALSPVQEAGEVTPSSPRERWDRLQAAFAGHAG